MLGTPHGAHGAAATSPFPIHYPREAGVHTHTHNARESGWFRERAPHNIAPRMTTHKEARTCQGGGGQGEKSQYLSGRTRKAGRRRSRRAQVQQGPGERGGPSTTPAEPLPNGHTRARAAATPAPSPRCLPATEASFALSRRACPVPFQKEPVLQPAAITGTTTQQVRKRIQIWRGSRQSWRRVPGEGDRRNAGHIAPAPQHAWLSYTAPLASHEDARTKRCRKRRNTLHLFAGP